MSCRLLVAIACLVGCADDQGVVRVDLAGKATQVLVLQGPVEDVEPTEARAHWEIASAPAASTALPPIPTTSTASFTPDLRGTYVIERWLRYGVGEDLTHRFVLTVAGAPPMPVAHMSGGATPGSIVMLDASESTSPEGRALSFSWRLTARPRDSQVVLASVDSPTSSFVPDVVGTYGIELAAFDGELWSDPHASLTIRAAAP